jgi:hypothetical protein
MKCRKCDGHGTMPGNGASVTFRNGIHLVEAVCSHCFNGEIPGQSEYWLCRHDSEEPVFLHENGNWYYYEPGIGWSEVKQGVVPIRRMTEG